MCGVDRCRAGMISVVKGCLVLLAAQGGGQKWDWPVRLSCIGLGKARSINVVLM
jgi:hypothetical protein